MFLFVSGFVTTTILYILFLTEFSILAENICQERSPRMDFVQQRLDVCWRCVVRDCSVLVQRRFLCRPI